MDAVKDDADDDAGVNADFLVRLRAAGQPPRASAQSLTLVRVVDPRYVMHAVLMGVRVEIWATRHAP